MANATLLTTENSRTAKVVMGSRERKGTDIEIGGFIERIAQ